MPYPESKQADRHQRRTATMNATTAARHDQLRAAANHARLTLTTVAEVIGVEPVDGTAVPWMAQAVAGWLRALHIKRDFCAHTGIDKPPAVMFGALWAPGRAYCHRCSWQLEE